MKFAKIQLVPFFAALVFSCFAYSQDADSSSERSFMLSPSIGLGAGSLSYKGDISTKGNRNPLVGRFGYDISLSTKINREFELMINFLTGTISANERSSSKNLNFKSRISSGGIHLIYNLGHLFQSQEPVLTPYLSLGIESFEFNPKSDMKDANGNPYYYNSNGSIQYSATNDSTLYKDYVYETDLRKQNIDSIGNYPQSSLAIPVGAGVQLNISPRIKMQLGASLHYTFTDLLDNVRNKGNDMFIFTSVSFHYNLVKKSRTNEEEKLEELLLAAQNADEDQDGVKDIDDFCPGTPPGETVDTTGCPPDDDNDGVPNYMDKQINTPSGAFTDADGIEIPDSVIELAYLKYIDSLPSRIRKRNVLSESDKPADKIFRVQLGAFPQGVNPSTDFINTMMSIPGIQSEFLQDGSTVFTLGTFSNPEEAEIKRQELMNAGKENLELVQWLPDYQPDIKADPKLVAAIIEENPPPYGYNPYGEKGKTIFRVQFGAFRKTVSANIFTDIKDVLLFKGDDGLNRYVSGEFENMKDAAKHKTEMMVKGFDDAFIVAYKDGKQIPLGSAGATMSQTAEIKTKQPGKKEIIFKVQLGKFKDNVPASLLEKYIEITDVEQQFTTDGTIFSSGSFSNYQQAVKHKNMLASKYKISDTFITAFQGEEQIDVKKAIELIKP